MTAGRHREESGRGGGLGAWSLIDKIDNMERMVFLRNGDARKRVLAVALRDVRRWASSSSVVNPLQPD